MFSEEVIVPIAVFSVVPVIIYLVHRHRERKALIEKGLDLSIFEGEKKCSILTNLKYGILSIGLAVGILLGNILDEYTHMSDEVAYFSMLFLFGGISLLLFYSIAQKQKE
jgi:hypothetical protein